jgi:hypothetical protein
MIIEPIVHTVTLSEQDLIDANKLHCARVLRSRRSLAIYAVIFGMLFVIIVTKIEAPVLMRVAWALTMAALLAVGAILAQIVLNAALIPRMARRNYAEQASLRKPAEIAATRDTLSFRQSDSHSNTIWDEFTGWSEDSLILLVYRSRALFNILPKRHFAADEIDQIRERLLSAGLKKI